MNQSTAINIKMLLNNRRDAFVAGGLFVGCLLLVVLAVVPQFRQARELQTTIPQERQKYERLDNKLDHLQQISFDPNYQERELVFNALPSRKPLLELLVGLSGVVRSSKIGVEEFKISPGSIATGSATLDAARPKTSTAGLTQPLAFTMTVSGPFANVQDFITNLERMSPFATITSLQLSNSNPEDENSQISAELAVNSYYFAQDIKTTLEAPLPQVGQNEQYVLAELIEFAPIAVVEQTRIISGQENFFDVDELIFESF